ncbi:MAG: hypothetical protein GY913_09435 [Proteobacteria bacterium]|nr:hypothetical protein [Pseudomonadota bacterium]
MSLAASLRTRRADLLRTFRPSPLFAAAMADDAHHMLWRTCNRLGKTTSLAYLMSSEALAKPAYRGRVIAPTRAQGREVIQRYLFDFLRPHLDPRSTYSPGTGFNRNSVVVLRNGSTIECRSLEDNPSSHEGGEFDRIGFDEPPTMAHLNANTGRTGPSREGLVLVTATMVNRAVGDLLQLRTKVEGRDDLPETGPGRHVMPTGWVQYVGGWERENVPWLTEEQYTRQLEKWRGTLEEPQRLWGAWEGASTARALSYFSTDHIISGMADAHMRDWPVYYLGIDHGKGMGKQVAQLVGVDPSGKNGAPEMYVMREFVGAGSDTPDVDARGILTMLRSVGISPYQISLARGDVGAGTESKSGVLGESRNKWIERQIATQLGLSQCPFRIEVPYKVGGLERVGILGMNRAFKDDRIHVYEGCQRFITSARTYQASRERADRDRKDGIDPFRYAVQDLLIERQGAEWVPLFW